MRIDFFGITEDQTEPEPVILDEWGFDSSPPDWWDKVTPEFKTLYNDFGPMVLITHRFRNYLL